MKKTMYFFTLFVAVVSLCLIDARLFASDTDDRIESSAKKSFVFKTFLKDDDIKIQSKDGVVTLSGTVSDETHKSLARETVMSLPGVISTNNNIVIKGEPLPAYTDAWIISKVKSTLLFHRNTNLIETQVSANDGIVTLRGEAINNAQKDLATEYAEDVDGVKKVKNEMTILTVPKKPGEKTMGDTMDSMTEAIDDASITALVKTALLYHRSTSAINTTVETNQGVVKLSGEAKNSAAKELATKFVNDVYGVKMVVNNMTVK